MSIPARNSIPAEPGSPDVGGPEDPSGPGTTPAGATTVLEETEEQIAPGDSERFAHYVRKDKITQSMVEGGPVVALCGKIWTPTRNPDKYPVCPTCKAIYESMKNGGGDNSWPFGPDVPGTGQ